MSYENEEDYEDLYDVRVGLINRARPLLHQEFLFSLRKMTPTEKQSKAREIGIKRKEGAIDWIHRNKLSTVEVLTSVLGNSDTSITYSQLLKWEKEGLITWHGSETVNAPKVIQITSKALDWIEPIRFAQFGERELNLQETKDQKVGLLVIHSIMIQNVIVEKLRQFPQATFLTETEVLQSHKFLTRGRIHKLPDVVLIVKSKKQKDRAKLGVRITGVEVERSGKDKQPQDLAIWAANQMISKNGADKFEYYVKDEPMLNRFKRTFASRTVPRYDDGEPRMGEIEGKIVHLEREIKELSDNHQLILLSKKEWARPLLVRHRLIKKVRVPIDERRAKARDAKFEELKKSLTDILVEEYSEHVICFLVAFLLGREIDMTTYLVLPKKYLKICSSIIEIPFQNYTDDQMKWLMDEAERLDE